MHLLALAQIFLVDPGKGFLTHLCGNRLDLLDQRPCRRTQGNTFGPAILCRRLAMHQPLRFETIEQAGQRRPFNGNALGQLALGGFVVETGQMQQHQPACLRESEIS